MEAWTFILSHANYKGPSTLYLAHQPGNSLALLFTNFSFIRCDKDHGDGDVGDGLERRSQIVEALPGITLLYSRYRIFFTFGVAVRSTSRQCFCCPMI